MRLDQRCLGCGNMKIKDYVKKPKIKKVPKEEAFERLWGDGKTINSNSTIQELPDGYDHEEEKEKTFLKEDT